MLGIIVLMTAVSSLTLHAIVMSAGADREKMKHYISEARLKTYGRLLKLSEEEQVLNAYYWNKALCGAIYPAMQTLEVTLRNALNEAVKGHHGGKYSNDDWRFEHIANDIQDKKFVACRLIIKRSGSRITVNEKKQSYAEQAVLNVQRELKKEGRTPVRHDDVISRVTFGCWVSMLGNDYEDETNKTLLWPNLLAEVFPHYSGKLTRVKIEASFKRVLVLGLN